MTVAIGFSEERRVVPDRRTGGAPRAGESTHVSRTQAAGFDFFMRTHSMSQTGRELGLTQIRVREALARYERNLMRDRGMRPPPLRAARQARAPDLSGDPGGPRPVGGSRLPAPAECRFPAEARPASSSRARRAARPRIAHSLPTWRPSDRIGCDLAWGSTPARTGYKERMCDGEQQDQGADDGGHGSADLLVSLGLRIRALRLRAGLTQTELGTAAAISQAFVARMETGRQNLSVRNLSRVALALNTTMSNVLRGIAADPNSLGTRGYSWKEGRDPRPKPSGRPRKA